MPGTSPVTAGRTRRGYRCRTGSWFGGRAMVAVLLILLLLILLFGGLGVFVAKVFLLGLLIALLLSAITGGIYIGRR